jgi:phosphatidylglycerol---prolipoprotein diacylglyceryl transferase
MSALQEEFMLAYYMHNLNPKIFEIWGYGPRWYGFAYLLGFVFAYFLVMRLARQGLLKVPVEKVPDMVILFCICGVLLGGRLGYVLFYDPHLLIDFSDSFPWWGVLRVNQGGMSAHGGVVGVVLAICWYAWRNKYSAINIGDASCMVVPIGLFFGRIANFINGELYGHITKVAWAVQFPTELRIPPSAQGEPTVDPLKVDNVIVQVLQDAAARSQLFHDHPGDSGLREAVGQMLKQPPHAQREMLENAPALRGDAIDTIINMVQHGNHQAAELLRNVLPARHPSQLYEALLEGVLLFVICWTVGQLWRKKGMASGAFLTFYPVMRIIGEQFRVGDTPADYLHIGHPISLGVLYSIPMFLFGLGFWIYFMTRPAAVDRKS